MADAAKAAAVETMLDRVEPMLRRWLRPGLWLLVVVPVVWMIARGVMGELGANPIERLETETGEWTLRLLAASLAVSPLIALTRWGWLIPHRRFLGIAAFTYASMHLMVYVGLDNFFDVNDIVKDVLKHLYITVGMAAFLMLLPLAITSTKGWIRRLGGKRWNLLHRLVYPAAVAGCVLFLWAVEEGHHRAAAVRGRVCAALCRPLRGQAARDAPADARRRARRVTNAARRASL